MSLLYELAGQFPFAEPEREAVQFAASAAGVTRPEGPEPSFDVKGLGVAAGPPDADELAWSPGMLGFVPNLSLLLDTYGLTDDAGDPELSMIRIATAFAEIPGFRGVLLHDYSTDEALVLTIDHGVVVANETWDGWHAIPELVAALPEGADLRPITLPGNASPE